VEDRGPEPLQETQESPGVSLACAPFALQHDAAQGRIAAESVLEWLDACPVDLTDAARAEILAIVQANV
jgi:hypothetical protein